MENQKTKGKKMCDKIFNILSKDLGKERMQRNVLEFKGCDSLIRFVHYLKIMEWKEFDIDIIERIIRRNECGCLNQKEIEEKLL